MANTYVLISSSTVGSGGASSITFSAIPATYTDLKVVGSARTDVDDVEIVTSVNGGALDSGKRLRGNGTDTASAANARNLAVNNSGATASTFSNGEWYFPNYTGNTSKSVSMDGVTENNATAAYVSFVAGLKTSTSAITSISFAILTSSSNFVQYSSFYLYGIKNS